ncbi:dockerin type I domain-containing protein [Candidatus Marinimicrobia bacterium]|nr:dockerin type I domain-containing protein [Candidatus Neomarinimicrobiota bacterium]
MSNQVQFRFIAQDTFNQGDVGSGGSLIEAGLDDFKIEIFEENSSVCTNGDLNLDLTVNIQDVVLMVNLIVNNDNFNNYLCSGDINGDGTINIQDIILVVSLILD